ncbi:MAG TPA: response regulator transcription factor [Saprospiraceae bacterium]|nr:response regulator transcription factor [Saprospiraceae bacterium]
MIRVAIFEDNKHLRETYEILLSISDQTQCVGSFPDGRNAVAKLKNTACDVILMDIEMPNVNGIEATTAIKKEFPQIHILIQTAFFDDEYIFHALCAGASGYLLKSTKPEGIIDAILEVVSGGSPMTPSIARKVIDLFKSNVQIRQTSEYNLTNQEKKVLQLLVDGKSYKMIATELFVSIDTIKSHMRNIYAKLHVHSGTEAVALALREKIV